MNNETINVAIPKICQTCEHHRLYEGTAFDDPPRGKRRLAIECAVKEFPESWQCDQWKLASYWNPNNVFFGDRIHIVKVNGPL